MGELETVLQALARSGGRYLVVGGVGVVLHGFPRFTADLDLVVQLVPANLACVLRALSELGYTPRVPVPASALLDPATRQQWIDEKNMTVFSFWNPRFPATEVDLFISEPFDFTEAFERRAEAQIGNFTVPVASLEDLIAMKRAAGRPKDLEDVAALEALRAEDSDGDE